MAQFLNSELSIKPKDAVHLACAIERDVDYFITVDESFRKKIVLAKEELKFKLDVYNPYNFVEKVVNENE